MKTFLISLLWAALFAAIIAFVVLEATGAPAPMPRRVKPQQRTCPTMPAHWYGYWEYSQWPGWTLHLMPHGKYQAFQKFGNAYEGNWHLRVEGGTISVHIEEWPVGDVASSYRYQAGALLLVRKKP